MNIKQWLKQNKEASVREKLAEMSGTTIGYINQLAYTPKKAGPEMCKSLRDASKILTPDTVIEPRDVRPDIAVIFNEIQDVEGAA